MKQQFEGRLVRFGGGGVGVVDVEQRDEYVYFKPTDIVGYKGQTVRELASAKNGGWKDGSTVIVQGDVAPSGNVHVESVTLKR